MDRTRGVEHGHARGQRSRTRTEATRRAVCTSGPAVTTVITSLSFIACQPGIGPRTRVVAQVRRKKAYSPYRKWTG